MHISVIQKLCPKNSYVARVILRIPRLPWETQVIPIRYSQVEFRQVEFNAYSGTIKVLVQFLGNSILKLVYIRVRRLYAQVFYCVGISKFFPRPAAGLSWASKDVEFSFACFGPYEKFAHLPKRLRKIKAVDLQPLSSQKIGSSQVSFEMISEAFQNVSD